MLSGATWSAPAIAGTAVLRMVVSSDSIKKATAISHGSRRLLEAGSEGCEEGASIGLGGLTFVGLGCIGLRDRVHQSSLRGKSIIAHRLVTNIPCMALTTHFVGTHCPPPPATVCFKNLYAKMHRGIVDHPAYLDAANVEEMRGMDFVFVCLDKATPKKLIVEKLEEFNIPFTDVGMGILLNDDILGGIVRVTTSTAQMREHFRTRVSFEDTPGDYDYRRNIQIADLNALNAALAVIKWKKLFGFYRDLKAEHHSQSSIDTNLLLNEDRPQ